MYHYSAGGGEQRVAEFVFIGVGVGSFRPSRKTAAAPVDIAGVRFYRCLHNGGACDLIFAEETWERYDINRHLMEPGRTLVSTVGSVQISWVLRR